MTIRIPSGNDKGKLVSELTDLKAIKAKIKYYKSRPDNEALVAALEVRMSELQEQVRQVQAERNARIDQYNDELRRAARAVHAGKYTCEQAAQLLAERFNASELGRKQIDRHLTEQVGYLRCEQEDRERFESKLAELTKQVAEFKLGVEEASRQLNLNTRYQPDRFYAHDYFSEVRMKAQKKADDEAIASGVPAWLVLDLKDIVLAEKAKMQAAAQRHGA